MGGLHGWRGLGFALIGVLVLGGVLLGLTAGRASGPTRVVFRKASAAHPPSPAELRSDYGMVPAPPAKQVAVKFKHGLRSGLLFVVPTGQVLWELNPEQVVPIASLTKMMSALVVLAHSRSTDRVLITPQAVHFAGSGIGNLAALRRPHFGGLMLLGAAALTLADLLL